MAELTAVRGDTWRRSAAVKNGSGEAYDFTGSRVWFTMKEPDDPSSDTDDSEALVKFYWIDGGSSSGITITDPLTGVMSIKIPASTMATLVVGRSYRYDVQVLAANGDVDTPDIGTITVGDPDGRDVTRRTNTP